MRRSIASLALLARRRADETEYLAQWNADWSAFHFIGGHKLDDESFRECLVREIGEELGLSPEGFSIGADPTAHLEFVAISRRAGAETDYTIELFEVELHAAPVSDEIERRPENAWLSQSEIAAGATRDGRAISPTMPLVLGKTARLPVPRHAGVFTIGVTGHRDLCSLGRDAVAHKLHGVFDRAEHDAGGRTIEALSPLAAGADQLFAQIALERGYRLIAPLPLPLDLYRRDFRTERGGGFERLLRRTAEWYSLPLDTPGRVAIAHQPSHGGQCPPYTSLAACREQVAEYGPARDAMYEAVGHHVVERSDLLVALWDGHFNRKRGGTGEIVAFARRLAAEERSMSIEVVPVKREKKD